jgi:uncharacterized protein
VNENHSGYINSRVLKLQVGFLLAEGKATSRETEFDIPSTIRVADDMMLNYLRGTLRLSRTSRGILIQGELKTSLQAECNRCLDTIDIELDLPIEEIFVYPPEPDADYTVADDGILDLAPLVREETILQTPINVLCKPDCAGLCPECGKNLNLGPCDCNVDEIDPRLSALKELKDKLSKQ